MNFYFEEIKKGTQEEEFVDGQEMYQNSLYVF